MRRRAALAVGILTAIALALPAGALAGPTPTYLPSACNTLTNNLVANCGFESNSWDSWTTGRGTGALESTYVGANYGHSGITYSGVETGEVGAPGYIEQDLATTIGVQYSVSFWLYGGATEAGTNFMAELIPAGGVPAILVQTGAVSIGWTQYRYTYTATATTTTLRFEAQNDPSYWYFDDVVVAAISKPVVLNLVATKSKGGVSISYLLVGPTANKILYSANGTDWVECSTDPCWVKSRTTDVWLKASNDSGVTYGPYSTTIVIRA